MTSAAKVKINIYFVRDHSALTIWKKIQLSESRQILKD